MFVLATLLQQADRVERPEPGLARGAWEAPAWVFWAAVLGAAIVSVAWMVVVLRKRKARG